MRQFDRPLSALTVKSFNDLPKGHAVFHVLGIYPVVGPRHMTKLSDVGTLQELDPELSEHLADPECNVMRVFKVLSQTGSVDVKHVSDANMDLDISHNDNYFFDTEHAAKNAVDYLRSCYNLDPRARDREIARDEALQDEWRKYDDHS